MTKQEQDFIKALSDGSIERAMEWAVANMTLMPTAWKEAIDSAIRVCINEKRIKAEARRRVLGWEGIWIWD